MSANPFAGPDLHAPAPDDIDLSDFHFWARPLHERETAFATLRAHRPVPFYAEPLTVPGFERGPGYYALTRHADIYEASRRPEEFRSGQGATSITDMPEEFREYFGSMIELDDPRHTRLRKIVSRGFTPRMLKRVQGQVEASATTIVDDIAEQGTCDFVTDVAARLPLKIICDMMGIPGADYDFVFDRTNVILGFGDPEYVAESDDIATALLRAGGELTQLVSDLGRYRAEEPADDLISALVNANVDGESLTDAELASFFILLVVAGNETTRNAMSHGLRLLTQNPDQHRLWASDFERYAPTAVEEIVRVASPVIWMRRTVSRNTELNGQSFAQGDKLLLFYWSGNRDEDVFDDPQRFDIARDPNPHVGFGGPSPHFCLGAHLARREITVMFRELFDRLPDIHATGEPDRLRSNFINGIKHLPAAFTPATTVSGGKSQ